MWGISPSSYGGACWQRALGNSNTFPAQSQHPSLHPRESQFYRSCNILWALLLAVSPSPDALSFPYFCTNVCRINGAKLRSVLGEFPEVCTYYAVDAVFLRTPDETLECCKRSSRPWIGSCIYQAATLPARLGTI